MRRSVRVTVTALLALVVAGVGLAGCSSASEGDGSGSGSPSVSAAVARCRAQWRDLEDEIDAAVAGQDGSAKGVVHLALVSRYTGLAASAAYWRVNATGNGCGAMLGGQQTALLQLRMLEGKATAYDAVLRTERAVAARAKLASSTLKETAPVAAAYSTLSRLAPGVAKDVAPGVATLDTFDPARPAEVQEALSNLALLARSSDSWPGWSTAMSRVTAFQRQQQARLGDGSTASPSASATPSASASATP